MMKDGSYGTVLLRLERANVILTVEELDAFKYISTYWSDERGLVEDRRVREFETYGGAVGDTLHTMAEIDGWVSK